MVAVESISSQNYQGVRPYLFSVAYRMTGSASDAEDLIQDALKTARGNRAKAARLLNTTGRIMNYKVRHLGIDWRRFKK